ncbi:MAG: YggS family pyridoxal phosphate-dependent enzyme [Chitinophagaceae bacterium]|nr:YggS family pyridoxal phosphate-dependent enzyme [Chitinophagaceae bacterium]MCW5905716.1 YggS family pyridoxal phosphate-dependent enzyme [Chitinophagaceae bacterium]
MNDDSNILHNLQVIQQRINNACKKANRNSNEVTLLLATKTVSAERIGIALKAGYTLIGENKVQEIKSKFEALTTIPHQTHFIGHLQTNKIKDILTYNVACIQTVDRIALAEKLHQRLLLTQQKIDVFIQVNTSAEESKFGVTPEKTIDLIKQVAALETLQIKGLMTIGLFSAEAEKVRSCFKILKNLQQEIIQQNISNVIMQELSMGMSGDMEIAIEEGATMIRVGTAIFGERIYPDSYYWNEQAKE